MAQAGQIDQKIDDGLPQSGNVAAYLMSFDYQGNGGNVVWIAGNSGWGASTGFRGQGNPTTAATVGSSSTCYDNGGIVGPQQYSVEQSGGSNINCALSFRFQ